MENQEAEENESDIKNDIKSTKAYNILTSLQEDHIIDEDTYNKYLKKLIKIQDCIVNYMEFEKLLDKRLNALKEENTKTLNEYAFLSKQQNDLNDKISKKLEEREQAKSQLTEYETNRALKSNYDIERNQEEIIKLKQAIKENEDRQMAQLMKELNEIEKENQQKKEEIQKLLNDITKEEENFKNLVALKEKMEFEKKKTEKEIGDLNSNIETKINQIENDNRTNKLNADAKKRLEDEIKKKALNLDQITKDIPKKIRLNSNFTTIKLNGTYVNKVSSTAEAQEKDLVSLKNLTIFGNLDAAILRNATFINKSPNYFKIRGEYSRYLYDSNNIELITIINGNPTKIQCKGKYEQDNTDDQDYYFLQPKSSGSFSNVDFGYTVGNFTKVKKGSKIFIIDFQDGTNSTIIDNNYFKKSSKGLSKGVICAIAIPTILLTLGVGALVFFLSRRPLPPPQPIKNVMNNTVGIASSGVVVNQ